MADLGHGRQAGGEGEADELVRLRAENARLSEELAEARRAAGQTDDGASRESEERLRLVLEAAGLGTWDLDLVNDVAVRSLRHDQIWGYDEPQAEWGLEIAMQHVVPEDRPSIMEAYERGIRSGTLSHENRVIWPDGSVHWIHAYGRFRYDSAGRPVRVMGVVADITERKRAEDALREGNEQLQAQSEELAANNEELQTQAEELAASNEELQAQAEELHCAIEELKKAQRSLARERELLQRVFDNIPVLLVMWDPRLKRFTLNRHAEDVLGWSTEDANTGDFMSLVYPDPAYRAEVSAYMQSLQAGWHEFQSTAKGGEQVPIDWANVRLGDDTSIGIGVDLRERKRAEEALRESEARYRDLVQNANSAIIRWKRDGTVTFFNEYAESFFGYRPEEILGRHVGILVPDRESTGGDLSALVDDIVAHPERHVSVVNENVRRDRSRAWMAWTNRPIYDDQGEVAEILAVGTDITARKEAEDAVILSEARLRLALDAAHMIAWEYDPSTKQVTLTQNAPEVLALPGRRVLESSDQGYAIIHPEDVEKHRALVEEAIQTGGSFVSVYRQVADGEVAWMEERGRSVTDESGKTVRLVGVTQNITERKRAEEALRRSEARWTAAIESFSIGAIIATEDEQVIYWNPAARKMHGFTHEGEGIEPLERTPITFQLWTPDKSHLLELDEWPMRRIKRGETVRNLELWLRRPDQGWEKYVSYSGSMVETPSGEHLIFLSVYDLTEQHRAEEALKEADRRKNEYIAMLSHELRNPLAAISSSVSLMAQRAQDDPLLKRAAEVGGRQVANMARMLDDLLDVARITRGRISLRREPVDVASVVQRAVETVTPAIEARRHRLFLSLPTETLTVEGDPVRLTQVFANLLDNAAKYTPDEGEIRVDVQRVDAPTPPHLHTPAPPYAEIRVRDTGKGISPDLLPHLFETFERGEHSSGNADGGLGLGLALVRHLVERHGGDVEARSEGPGKGSEFIVRLPLLSPSAPAAASGPAGEEGRLGRRVLLVEDNRDTAELLTMALEIEGHEVAVAHDGPSALETAGRFRPDVALLDIGLPGMDGYEVARRMRQEPALAGTLLVALTGFGRDEDRERARQAGIDRHLVKPVRMEDLRRVLAVPGSV